MAAEHSDLFQIPMSLYAENRQKLLARLEPLDLPKNGIILMQGGEEVCRYDTDHEPVFRQESYFHYLFGVKEPGFYGALDIDHKKAVLFCPHLLESYTVWMGKILSPDDFCKIYEVDEVRYVENIEDFLAEMKPSVVYTMTGVNTDSGAIKPEFFTTPKCISNYLVDNKTLFPELVECRVIKSAKELEVLRYVNRKSSAAHEMVMKRIRPGWHEHQAEAVFRYETYYHGGCRNMSYTCICASGENGATLHYGHAGAPNDKLVRDGEMLVFDMGAEYKCFCSDVTRSFPVNGRFTDDQRAIYETVLEAQDAVMKAMKPGVEWADMHRLSLKVIVEGLLRHGFLVGDVDELMRNHIGTLFMPHGLGHLLGLETHDVGGYPAGVERIQEPGIKSLRANRTLKPNMVLTVEPGIYFTRPILVAALSDPAKSKFLVADKIQQFLDFGGVRIEDDVIVTETGIENMTTAARTVAEIEALCAQGRKEFP